MIHRFWCGDNPTPYPIIDRYVESMFPTVDWTLDTIPSYAHDLISSTSHLVSDEDFNRHAANIARLAILHENGGVYLDHDIIPLCDIVNLPRPFIGSYGGVHTMVANGVMGFDAGHELLKFCLDAIPDSRPGPVPQVSGSWLIADHFTADVTLINMACDMAGQPLPGEPFAFHVGKSGVK